MSSEMKKLKGCTIKTLIGQFLLKQYVRLENTEFDQIYFKTHNSKILLKIYDLERPVSNARYQNETECYRIKSIPMLHDNIHSEEIKIKKKDYGLIIFLGLNPENSLSEKIYKMDEREIMKLSLTLIRSLLVLKENNAMFCNFRPQNIYKVDEKYVVINSEYLCSKRNLNNMDDFLRQVIDKNWEYWSPEVIDPYSKEILDHKTDIFAAGCILYQGLNNGLYPFQSKLTVQSSYFIRIEEKGLMGQIVNSFLDTSEKRSQLRLKEIYEKLSNTMLCSQSPTKIRSKQEVVSDQQSKKNQNNGFLENISTAFSKMMNDTQGFFLNYVEDNPKMPQEKFLNNILAKLYRSEEKSGKLCSVILKHIKTCNESKKFTILKTLLLIGKIFRKGPRLLTNNFSECLETIKRSFHTNQISSLCSILIQKVKLHQKLKKCLCGNFYLLEISNFKRLSLDDLSQMVIYLKKLVSFVEQKVRGKEGIEDELSNSIIQFACDDIFDLISMLIVSVICIRKDNSLQLRKDNLKELVPIEKIINNYLKRVSDLSNNIGAHAIYSLEREYICYKEEISLRVNPYYSSLEHFYRSSRNFKGISIPEDYSAPFVPKESKRNQEQGQVDLKVEEPFLDLNKQYFGEQVQSEEETDFNEFSNIQSQKQKIASFSVFEEFSKKTNANKIRINLQATSKDNKSKNEDKIDPKNKSRENKSSKDSKNSKSEKSDLISFAEFGNINIPKTNKQNMQINEHKSNDFSIFFDFKDKDKCSQNKPPLPGNQKKVKSKKIIQKQMNVPHVLGFEEFSQILNQQKNKKQTLKNDSLLDLDEFVEIKNKNPSNNSELIKNFDNLFGKPKQILKAPQISSYFEQKILSGLKLKELKDLLKQNPRFFIEFSNLNIIRQIGSGSAGEVYLGKFSDKSVAIKKVKAKQNPNALKQFERQLVTYIKIGVHPFLVSLVGLSESNGDFFLITQFCSSGSLFDLLHKKKDEIQLLWNERIRFAIQIAEGMKCLHSMKPVIIHRDLKSLNVFVSKQKDKFIMKVADFGLSRSPEAEMMTTQLGTIHWMAPELLEGKQYSLKVDVYSYGILLWEILARKTPYSHLHNAMGIIKYVAIDRKRPQIDSISFDCPRQLITVMQRCWSHEPETRPNFSQIIEHLKKIKI